MFFSSIFFRGKGKTLPPSASSSSRASLVCRRTAKLCFGHDLNNQKGTNGGEWSCLQSEFPLFPLFWMEHPESVCRADHVPHKTTFGSHETADRSLCSAAGTTRGFTSSSRSPHLRPWVGSSVANGRGQATTNQPVRSQSRRLTTSRWHFLMSSSFRASFRWRLEEKIIIR